MRRLHRVALALGAIAVSAATIAASLSCDDAEDGGRRPSELPWARTDDPVRDAARETRWIETALDLRPGSSVADIGTGAGYFAFRFARAVGPSGRVIATDTDPKMVEHVQREAARRGVRNLEARRVPTNDPGLDRASVDRIVLVNSLTFAECGQVEPRAYLAACHGALRPGGRLVIFRDQRHTTEWEAPYASRPACDEPDASAIIDQAARFFRPVQLTPVPTSEPGRGIEPGFLLVLEPW